MTYSIGPYLPIVTHACVQLAIPIIFLLTFFWSPESPYYLVLRNRKEEAERSLQRFRGRYDVKEELASIIDVVSYEQQNAGSFAELFQTRGNRRGVISVVAMCSAMQLCGSQAVLAYSQQIFEEADGILDPKLATILLGFMQLAAAILASIIVDKVGRRPLLILSSCGVSLMCCVIGTYFFIKEYLEMDMQNLTWLPIILIIVYIVVYNIGLSTVSFALIGELFPTNVKAYTSSLAMSIIGLLAFAVTKMYQIISDGIGTYSAYWIFSFCATIFSIVIIIYVPETKGKTLAQIQIDVNNRQHKTEKISN